MVPKKPVQKIASPPMQDREVGRGHFYGSSELEYSITVQYIYIYISGQLPTTIFNHINRCTYSDAYIHVHHKTCKLSILFIQMHRGNNSKAHSRERPGVRGMRAEDRRTGQFQQNAWLKTR